MSYKINYTGGTNTDYIGDLEEEYKDHITTIEPEINFEFLKNLNCKEIIKFLESSKSISQNLGRKEWYILTDNINIPDYPHSYSQTNPENPEHNYRSLMTQNVLCNDVYCQLFFTKCLHKYLIDKYGNQDLRECWYQSIRDNIRDDDDEFNHFIDTTTIGVGAFEGNQLTSVVIPNSVTTIGNNAFNENNLTSVVIPNSVTTIGAGAFQENQLTSVEIPDSVTEIGIIAFQGNQLTSVVIPDFVISIGNGAFIDNQLTSVVIGNSVTEIGEGAFQNNVLTSVVFKSPSSVISIGNDAFQGNQLTFVEIPNSVTSIGNNAFEGNQLTSVIIGSSVESIGLNAFRNNNLTSVIVPKSVPIDDDIDNVVDYDDEIAVFDPNTQIVRNYPYPSYA